MIRRNSKGELMYEWDDLPDVGDLMEINVFIELCTSGGFINSDGHGNYASETGMTNITVSPSHIINNNILPGFSHVIWFNRY